MSREQQAAELRARIQAEEPALLTFLDGMRAVFGQKQVRVKSVVLESGFTVGDPDFGSELVPYPPAPPKGHRNDQEAREWLREAEASHIERHAPQRPGARARGSAARGRRA